MTGSNKGTLLVLASILACLIACWLQPLASGGATGFVQERLAWCLGALALLSMAWCFVLAARLRWLEGIFGGLDRMYLSHARLGLATVVFALGHLVLLPEQEDGSEGALVRQGADASMVGVERGGPHEDDESLEELIETTGSAALVGLLVLAGLTFSRSLAYHRWYLTHRVMGLVYLVSGTHVALVLLAGAVTPTLSVWSAFLALTFITGLLAWGWRLLLRGKCAQRFEVTKITRLDRASEVLLRPTGEALRHRPGQFAFVKFIAPGLEESHPFTIASAPRDEQLRFLVGVAGDYTRRLRDSLEVGTVAEVEGPFGRFDPVGGPDRQVWIAGGIGVTPFLSVLRELDAAWPLTVHFYYCVRSASQAPALEEVGRSCDRHDRIHFACLESNAGQRLDLARLAQDLEGELSDWTYYLCGPAPQVHALTGDLRRAGVPRRRLVHERFELR